MTPRFSSTSLALLLASTATPWVAYSKTYLTEEAALGAIFPGEKFEKKTFNLSPEEVKQIAQASDERVVNTALPAWVSPAKNIVFIDQVVGKHEFITYAVGITAKKTVQSIEILEYRETYGHQVREEGWRKQFVGKDATAVLKVNKDIVNISGATLSSVHITDGVRRILQTYEVIRQRL